MASNWSYFPNNFDCVLRHAPPACFCILRKKSLRYMELYNLRQYTWWHAYIIIGLMYIWVAWFVYRIGVVSRFCSFAWCSIRWQFQVHNLEWKMSEFVCVYVRPCGRRRVEHTKYCLATSSVDSNLFSLARLIQSFSIATLIIWLNGERDLWLKMRRSWNLFFSHPKFEAIISLFHRFTKMPPPSPSSPSPPIRQPTAAATDGIYIDLPILHDVNKMY